MNTQIRFTSVEANEAKLTMQARLDEAEAYRLAHPAPDQAEPRISTLRRGAQWLIHAERQTVELLAEFLLEAGDVLHGHRPHRHHLAHQPAGWPNRGPNPRH